MMPTFFVIGGTSACCPVYLRYKLHCYCTSKTYFCSWQEWRVKMYNLKSFEKYLSNNPPQRMDCVMWSWIEQRDFLSPTMRVLVFLWTMFLSWSRYIKIQTYWSTQSHKAIEEYIWNILNFPADIPFIATLVKYKFAIPFIQHSLELTHWDRDNMAAILQTTFSNSFSWIKMFIFGLNFHRSLYFWVTMSQHWSR